MVAAGEQHAPELQAHNFNPKRINATIFISFMAQNVESSQSTVIMDKQACM